jgi:hypothetical protein
VNHPEFVLRLRAPVDPTDPDGTRRLRAALKRMLRSYGLRALEVRRADAKAGSPTPPTPPGV